MNSERFLRWDLCPILSHARTVHGTTGRRSALTWKARLFCAECAAKRGLAVNLSPAALAAMRHIVYSDDKKIFAFTLGEEALAQLSLAAGQYTAVCLDKPMKTLSFLETILT